MLSSNFRQYGLTFLPATLAVVLTVRVTSGFMFLFFVPFIAVSVVFSGIAAVRRPEKRRLALVRIVVWLVVVPAPVGAAHMYWYRAARTDADKAVSAVVDFKKQTGAWPKSLQEAGIDDPNFGRRWMLGYLLNGNRPFIVYTSTFEIFDSYTYDFDRQRWDFNPD